MEKISAVEDWPVSQSKVRSFLGLFLNMFFISLYGA